MFFFFVPNFNQETVHSSHNNIVDSGLTGESKGQPGKHVGHLKPCLLSNGNSTVNAFLMAIRNDLCNI